MKTRKTKKRNIIRRAVAFLLCMTMVLGLGMQDVIEQVYAEEATPVIEQEAATEEAGELTTEGAAPEENAETAEEPDESVGEAEEQPANSTPSQPADAEENTKTDVPSAPAENAGSEEGEKQNPSAPAEDGQSGSDSETSAETNPGGNTGNEITAPTEDENTVTNPDETTGEDTEDDAAVSDEEEETTEPEEKVTELTYAAEDGSFSVTAAAVGEDTDLSSYELHASQVQKDGEEADRYAAAEELIAGALDAESRRIEELQAYDIWFTYTESGETADLSGQVQISLEYTAPEFPEGTDVQLEVFCLNGGTAEAVDRTDALAAGCELYALAWAVPAGYEKTWEDGQVIIRVTAEEGVLPAGAELSVTPIVKTEDMGCLTEEQQNAAEEINAQYDLTEKKLNEEVEENGETLGGFLAYDISFLVNGEKTEPNGNVSVTMEFKEAVLPEGVSEDARVSVKHLKEDAEAEDGITVEDVSEKAEVQNAENAAVEKVMLSADSFSTYAITWAYGSLSIIDNIIEEGTLVAQWLGSGQQPVGYQWYRSDSEYGEYKIVEKVSFENGASNLSETGDKLYPAYDKGAQKWYKVKAVFENEPDSDLSGAFQVPYYDELQNGSFERPAYMTIDDKGNHTHETMTQVSNSDYKTAGGVWQTTGKGSGDKRNQDIEILGVGKIVEIKDQWGRPTGDYKEGLSAYYAWQNGQTASAADGEQFAELNCEATGALYQDVLTVPGESLNYYLSHRARGKNSNSTEYDTMFLVIMPTSESQNLTTQQSLEEKLRSLKIDIDNYNQREEASSVVYDESGILVVRITSDDQDWHNISGIEGYTPTSSMTRFFFMAGKTASGNQTEGNFLDAVWFSQDLPPVAEDEFSLEIKKEFKGLSREEIEQVRKQIQFTISATDSSNRELGEDEIKELFGTQSIKGEEMTLGADGSLTYNKIANREIGDTYNVTITEQYADLEGGYSRTTSSDISVTVGDNTPEISSGDESASISNLTGDTVVQVTFTNTYTKSQTKDINFTKVWDDNRNAYDTRPDSIEITLNASANGTDINTWLEGQEVSRTITLNGDKNEEYWRYTWKDVPVYYTPESGEPVAIEYTVTESGLDTGDYVYEATAVREGDGSGYKMTVDNLAQAERAGATANNALPSAVAADSGSTGSGLGEPGHRKYIEYDEDTGTYTLNLNVTGAKGDAKGVDVLFVIDTSGSMKGDWVWDSILPPSGHYENRLLEKAQDLLTENNGIIDQIFKVEDNVNSVAYVSFATNASGSNWYRTANKEALKERINELEADGGTNWTAAMQRAESMLSQRDNGNSKVVIFLSDGAPTFTIKNGQTEGDGNTERASYRTDAANVVNNSSTLQAASIYSVYLNNSTKSKMEDFDTKLVHPNNYLVDGTDLSGALENILKSEIPTYKEVVIEDTLSEFVDFVGDKSNITVTKTNAGGYTSTLEPGDYNANIAGKKVTVKLLNGSSLEAGATYTVSFVVKPSEEAIQKYAESGYLHKGEAGTGETSDGQEGFRSNDSAQVSYEVNDVPDSVDYKHPVIQVPETKKISITVKKNWDGDGEKVPVEIALYCSANGGEAELFETVTLGENEKWDYTWENLPLSENGYSYDYHVEELTELEGYTSVVSADKWDPENWTFTVLNTYDANTADEDYYIANVLQTERVEIKKNWNDNHNTLGKRPGSISVLVIDGAGKQYRIPVSGTGVEDVWTAEIVIPKAKNSSYNAQEVGVDTEDYQTSGPEISGQGSGNVSIEFTNTLQVKTITVNKIWNDGNISSRPAQISIRLLYSENGIDWIQYGSDYTMSGTGDKWSMTIEDLPAYYYYRVQEIGTADGYVSETPVFDGDSEFTITNTLDWSAEKRSSKLQSGAGMESQPLQGANFELRSSEDNTLIAKGVSLESGKIEWTPEPGVESDLNNLNGAYEIIETKAPEGYQLAETPWKLEFEAGLLVSLNGQKVEGTAKDGVVITLENEILYELPSTGGPGIYLYMLGGVALMMAGTLLVYKKRKEEVLRS